MTTTTSRLNQVDIETVGALIGAIREEPAKAQTVWGAEVRWTGGFRSESRVRDFEPVPSDEPAGLGGDDSAANPVEQLLGALGNCLAVGYAANATAAGIALRDVTISLEGDIDLHTFLGLTEGNAGYNGIKATVNIDSDATAAQLEELHNKVVATSPVGHTLSRPIPVSIELG
ncbi:MAG: OsmC family protein [Acidimicrobiia bacterium]